MTTVFVRRPFRNSPSPLMARSAWEIVTPRAATLKVAMDVYEDVEGYTVEAALPGINPAELELMLESRTLTIKGEVKQPTLPEGAKYHTRERLAGTFERTLRFPVALNNEAVAASYEHGILTLRLPKAASQQPRRIEVQPTKVAVEG